MVQTMLLRIYAFRGGHTVTHTQHTDVNTKAISGNQAGSCLCLGRTLFQNHHKFISHGMHLYMHIYMFMYVQWQRKIGKLGEGLLNWRENISMVKIEILWSTLEIRWGCSSVAPPFRRLCGCVCL